jgi:hypothetical protein
MHIEVYQHFVQGLVEIKLFDINFVITGDQITDWFTNGTTNWYF